MEKLFVAVKEYGVKEKDVAGLQDPSILSRSCALGDIFGYFANFYEFNIKTHEDADRLARQLMENTYGEIYLITTAPEGKLDMTGFIKRAVNYDRVIAKG